MGAAFWPAFGKFIAAVFGYGSVGTGWYAVAVYAARIAVVALASKALAPRLDLSNAAQEKLRTIRDPISPQAFVYGEDMLSGPIIYGNTDGDDNRELYLTVAMTGHEIDSVQGYRLDDVDVSPGDLSGSEDGTVDSGDLGGTAEVELKKGTVTQTVSTILSTVFPSLFTTDHRGRGWSYMVWKWVLIKGSDAYERGAPQNVRAIVRGYRLFDRRAWALNADPLFKTYGASVGSGRLRWFGDEDQTTVFGGSADSVVSTNGILQVQDNDDTSNDLFAERIPVDTTKQYTVRVDARQVAGDRKHYLGVAFFDSGGNNILASGDSATGWDSKGTYFYYHTDAVVSGDWTTYSIDFGASATAQFPQNTTAVEMCIVCLLVRDGAVGTDTTVELRNSSIFQGTTPQLLNGAALIGDGTNELNGGDVTDYDFISTANFTVEFWFKPRGDEPGNKTIVGKLPAGGPGWSVAYQDSPTTVIPFIDDGTNDAFYTPATIDPTKWNHFAMVVDRLNDELLVYFNGELDPGSPLDISAVTGTLSNTEDFKIFAGTTVGAEFEGGVTELRIWSGARTAQEIRDNFRKQVDATEASLLGYYELRGTFGSTSSAESDLTANANDLTAVGGGVLRYIEPTRPLPLPDKSSHVWADNPANCMAHFMMDKKFGMQEPEERIDWPLVINAANVCDELVAIPVSQTQARYTLNATFYSTERRGEVRDAILVSMLGRMVFSQGLWKMWAGAALTPDVTLTGANLRGRINLQASEGAKGRYNRVRGKYVDPAKNYTAASYPEVRSSLYEAQDGYEVRPLVADFTGTNNFYEAQRKAITVLKQSRQQRLVHFEGNMSCWRVQPGTTVLLEVDEYGFAGEKFFVSEWSLNADGVDLLLVEEIDASWTEPAEGEYSTRSPTGAITFFNQGIPPVTSPSVVAIIGGARISWTNPPDYTFSHIEVWAALENVRGSAVLVGTTKGESFDDVTTQARERRHYWLRAVNQFGTVSLWTPNLTTTTLIADPLPQQGALNTDPDFDFSDDAPFYDLSSGVPVEAREHPWVHYLDDDAGPSTTRDTEFQFLPTGGAEGSAAVKLIWGDPSTSPNRAQIEIRAPQRIRHNSYKFRIEIRYRNNGSVAFGDATPGDDVSIFMRGYATATSTSQIAFGAPLGNGDLSFPVTGAGWVTRIFTTEGLAGGSGLTTARFWEFGFGGSSVNGTLAEIEIDSIFIFPMEKEYEGATSTEAGKIGVVPSASTAQVYEFLRADGLWAQPSGLAKIVNTDYTLVLTDEGKTILKQSGGSGETITIPANASVEFRIGTRIWIQNDGGGSLTVAITTDTLEDLRGVTGSQILGDKQMALVEKIATTKWRYHATDSYNSTTRYKTATETLFSTTTFQNDDHLINFVLRAGYWYKVEGLLIIASNNTANIKFDWSFTQTPQNSGWGVSGAGSGGNLTGRGITGMTGSLLVNTTNTNTRYLHVSGFVRAHATLDGTCTLRWAQNTSNAGVTGVHLGSWITFTRMN